MRRGIRVLHVDDDADFASLAARTLEHSQAELEVTVETSASDGLKRLSEESFDCIVSDYQMPDTDGLAFLEAVREEHPDLPFVLFTGDGSESLASEAISAGATDYLQKKTGTDQFGLLANRIESAVSRWRARTDYRRIFENATDGISVHDTESGEIIDANQRFCELLDYDREELLGASVDEFSATDRGYTRKRAERRIQLAQEEGPQVFEWVVKTDDGETLPLEVRLKQTRLRGRECVLAIARDISERKAREREFRQERAFVESLFDAIPDVVYALDESGSLVRWNERVAEVTGYSHEEISEMEAIGFFEGEDARAVSEAVGTVISERQVITVEADVVTKEDETTPYEFVGAPLVDEDGNLRGVVGSGRDVSKRERRKLELERYESILDAVGDAVFELDAYGFFTAVNDYTAEILGYEESELVGMHLADVIASEDLSTAQKNHKRLLDEEVEYETFEVAAKTADGEVIPCEVRSTLAPERADAEIRGSVGVVRDIRDRKQRQQELQRQNERLEEFASIVSHDLKNPLGVARGRVRLAQETCDSEHLDITVETLDRMEELIDRTLTLARKGQTVGETQRVELASVAKRSWSSAAGQTGRLELFDPPAIEADPDRLQHLLENLFGNAIEHGSAGSRVADAADADEGVTVTVGSTKGGFYVEDDGVGIPEAARQQVLEAGVTTTDSGTGLGLAIVRQIAEAHGWSVAVTDAEAGGARIEFTGVEVTDDE